LRYFAKGGAFVDEVDPHVLNHMHDGGAYGPEKLELSYHFYPAHNVGFIPPPVVTYYII